ncbi:MAG: hypothetical protein M1277_01645 [Patescibacteria group bacterium]|nr:hypothetical protein [Patescibacteria group bacterium]
MNVVLDPAIHKKLKKLNVRTRKSFKERIEIFQLNPFDPILDNHPLERELIGYRSIDITTDYRAIFEELHEGGERIYYFFLIGTHDELYKPIEEY